MKRVDASKLEALANEFDNSTVEYLSATRVVGRLRALIASAQEPAETTGLRQVIEELANDAFDPIPENANRRQAWMQLADQRLSALTAAPSDGGLLAEALGLIRCYRHPPKFATPEDANDFGEQLLKDMDAVLDAALRSQPPKEKQR